MKKNIYIFLFLLIFSKNFAQKFKNEDYVYQPEIKSVTMINYNTKRLFTNDLKRGYILASQQAYHIELLPAATIGSQFRLTFDDLTGENRRFRYKIAYCNADWSPTQLSELEFSEGFLEDNVPNPVLSTGTNTNYSHYTLSFPNSSTILLLSGNYLIHIFEDNNKKTPILTRRFMLYEQILPVAAKMVAPAKPDKNLSHQEFDFSIEIKNFTLKSPNQELNVSVLQNGRWDTEINNLKPAFNRGNELSYDFQDSLVFPAGKEFQYFDIRTLLSEQVGVRDIDDSDRHDIKVELLSDKVNVDVASTYYTDLNGGFFISNNDLITDVVTEEINRFQYSVLGRNYERNEQNNTQNIGERRQVRLINSQSDVRSEYANVLFSLKANAEFADADVYVVGKAFDWQLYPENKMFYDDETKQYLAEIQLKQGYYNYAYAVVPKEGKQKPYNIEDINGNWHETENDYNVIIYYRPRGGRFDRIIGIGTINSLGNRKN
jgi:Domain of unknown function (DUF5103)